MIAIIVPIESECSSFSEVPSNLGFLTRKVFLKNHRVSIYKKSNSLKANFLQKNPSARMEETNEDLVLF